MGLSQKCKLSDKKKKKSLGLKVWFSPIKMIDKHNLKTVKKKSDPSITKQLVL